jgi:hypothetical protein
VVSAVQNIAAPGLFDQKYLELVDELQRTTLESVNHCVSTVPLPARTELESLIASYANFGVSLPLKFSIALAIDLGVQDKARLEALAHWVTLGCLYSDFLDDIVDTKGRRWPIRNVYLAHIIFDFYLNARIKLLGGISPAEDSEFLAIELETYSALFEEEYNHVDVSRPFASQNLVWQKAAPLKEIARQILGLANRAELKPQIYSVIERASFAALVLDDISDWEEDYELRRFTYPLQMALNELGIEYQREKHAEIKLKILRVLCYGTLYHELMREIIKTFDDCGDAISGTSVKLAALMYQFRDRSLMHWKSHVEFLVQASAPTQA